MVNLVGEKAAAKAEDIVMQSVCLSHQVNQHTGHVSTGKEASGSGLPLLRGKEEGRGEGEEG